MQSQQVKRISTHFTTPAKTEKKSSQPKSEAVQKLLDEKAREKQRQKDAEEKERRRRGEEEEHTEAPAIIHTNAAKRHRNCCSGSFLYVFSINSDNRAEVVRWDWLCLLLPLTFIIVLSIICKYVN